MQVLYTTPPLEPFYSMAFSSQLEAEQREMLTNAILQRACSLRGIMGCTIGYLTMRNRHLSITNSKHLVDASGVNVAGLPQPCVGPVVEGDY